VTHPWAGRAGFALAQELLDAVVPAFRVGHDEEVAGRLELRMGLALSAQLHEEATEIDLCEDRLQPELANAFDRVSQQTLGVRGPASLVSDPSEIASFRAAASS
jgi:hypothetical protein